MPKRKRSDIEETIDKIEDRAVRIKASRLQAKIDLGNKSLKTALSLARGFERQKLGRRQKAASDEPHTLLRLREEVIVLKELEITKTAHNYLFKQLAKTKRVRESAAFVALYGEDPKTEAPKNNAEANVLGRLFKANPVKEVLPGILDSIKQVLNLDDTTATASGDTSTKAKESVVLQKNLEDSNLDATDEFSGFSDELATEEIDGLASSDDESHQINLAAYESRLAASSSGEENDVKEELDPMEISDLDGQDHDSQSSLSQPPSNASDEEKAPAQRKSQATATAVTSTSFLPSLSMGGYYSGSESGDNDDDDRYHGPAIPKERNNRRGQRERQKLAELKFGKNAKHLQKQQKNKDDRSSGWDAKRGAVESGGSDSQQRGRYGKGNFARTKGPTGANGEAMVGNRATRSFTKPSRQKEGPLHPSWEAAKKRKQETGRAAFTGKKITFD